MKQRTTLLAVVTLAVLSLFVSCDESKEKTAANDAIKALRKIEAATQVGVNFQQYGQLVIEAKAQVNDATAKLPDGELKKELSASMEAYADAAQAWNEKIGGRTTMSADVGIGKVLIPKYSLPTETYSSGLFPHVDIDTALQVMWGEAKKHLDKASSLADG